ncbi:MAG: 30S ribosomal protein S12 methylthiotransferase RimO [candidate division Zixibacteria bacterium]|nr:30S ribosomal protein S12 methylthiotransferase RimO [Candidatus Tariuqbacter arcticus]
MEWYLGFRVKFVNLGCSKNLVDSEWMAGLLNSRGVGIVDEIEEADCLVVNTCAFIEDARKEAVEAILAGAEWKSAVEGRRLFIAGCMPQRYADELRAELPEVDGFFGVGDYDGLVKAVDSRKAAGGGRVSRFAFTPRHYRYLRIADGCDRGCSYCSIPLIRGRYRSREMDEILREAEVLIDEGAKELVVIGQEISGYGSDLKDGSDLIGLLKRLVKIDGIEWVRLLYLHPPLVDEELVEFIAGEEKVCPYFDFPIEHINDDILRRMNRRINRNGIIKRLETMRRLIPDCAIRTSLMAGFPGETEGMFRELADFAAEGWFDRLGVFVYSPEAGTPAYNYDCRIPSDIAQSRREIIMEIQREVSRKYNESRVGEICRIIVDGWDDEGRLMGRTVREAPEIDGVVFLNGEANPGEMVEVEIVEAGDYDLEGEVLSFEF